MKLSAPKWDNQDGEQDGLLFFSQRLDEMLFNYTIDLYKAPVKNTRLLLTEYLSVIKDPDMAVKYAPTILNEIVDTLGKDIVVKKYWGNDNVARTVDTLKSMPEKAEPALIEYLHHVFGGTHYFDWCCEYIKWIIPQHNQKDKIEYALKCFIPELIGKGYSPEYIYHFNRKCILRSETPSIDDFINRFDSNERTYKVYIAVEKTIAKFQTLLKQRMGIKFEDDGNYDKYKYDPNLIVIHIDDVSGLDDNQAAKNAFQTINLFLRFYTAVDNKEQPKFASTAMVIENNETPPSFVAFTANGYSVIEGMKIDEASKYTEDLITNLITHARCSLPQLVKAIDLHNNSLRSPDYSSSFLNLWSALEVLSLKGIGNNDLDQVAGTLLPILQISYYKTAITDFMKKTQHALPRDQYEELLKRITSSEKELEKIAYFLFLDEYTDLRDEYSKLLTAYPVLRYRIHSFSELSKSKREMLSVVEKYKQRVEWHLSRIYRTRNALVHSGQAPQSIRHLGEHLHYYVDLLMMESFEKLSSGVQFCKLDNALIDSLLACEIFKKLLHKKDAIKQDDIPALLCPIFTTKQEFEYTCDCE